MNGRAREPQELGDWSDPRRVADYLSRQIPNRAVAERLLIEALPTRVDCFVDLGTGDGRLLAIVRDAHPAARGIGIDSSAPMLDLAQHNFVDDSHVELRQHDLSEALPNLGPVDAVVSALAIHHLVDTRKRTLFREIHSALTPGGVFVNLDLVAAASPERHRRFRDAIGRPEDDPSDHLGGMCAQLRWLGDAGFAEVECEYKWLELALLVGVRPTGHS